MKFLFDLGGVFFDWDPKYFFKSIFSSNEELNYFLTHVCNNEWNIKQDAGKLIKDADSSNIDEPVRIGDPTRIKKLGWSPLRSIESTLAEMLRYWREDTI